MEVNSVRAYIEKKSKHVDIFDLIGWFTVVPMKYQRHQVMDSSKFLNFAGNSKIKY